MSKRPPDSLKPLANRLAELLDSDDGTRALRLMQQIRETFALGESPRADAAPSHGGTGIGIWEAEKGGASFMRSPSRMHEWHYWANFERVPQKSPGVARIAFLGESVARGYLYDPLFTPAIALGSLLDCAGTGAAPEILDFARTDLNIDDLAALARASLASKPDALVVFAGNNWGASSGSELFRDEIATLFRQGHGFPAVRRLVEILLRQKVDELLDVLEEIRRERGIPIVFVFPEFNLGDWRWEGSRKYVPWLQSEDLARWYELVEGAESCGPERADEAIQMLQDAVELDGGNCAESLGLLGQLLLASGRVEEARTALERAKDSAAFASEFSVPRPYSVLRARVVESAPNRGLRVVDLREVFRSADPTRLPDRRWFLDYCHISSEGIRVAMGAAARELAELLPSALVARKEAGPTGRPSPSTEATAHFLAAIHNASWGQGPEICRYHIARAIEIDPAISHPIGLYAVAQSRPTVNWLAREFPELIVAAPSLERYLFSQSDFLKLGHYELVDAIVAELAKIQIDVRGEIHANRGLRPTSPSPTDLLDTLHSVSSWADRHFHSGRAAGRGFYAASNRVSTFRFRAHSNRPCSIRATLRLPLGTSGPVRVLFNGLPLTSVDGQSRWTSHEFEIPAERVRVGTNEVLVVWPIPSREILAVRSEIIQRIELGAKPDFFPTYGEIHRLSLSEPA